MCNRDCRCLGRLGDSSPVDPEVALFAGSAVAFVSYVRYVRGVVTDICGRLGIECFRIKHTRSD